MDGHEGGISCPLVNDQMLISGSVDKAIKIWDLESGKELRTLDGKAGISCLTVKDGMLISGSLDKTIKIWDFTPYRKMTHGQPGPHGLSF